MARYVLESTDFQPWKISVQVVVHTHMPAHDCLINPLTHTRLHEACLPPVWSFANDFSQLICWNPWLPICFITYWHHNSKNKWVQKSISLQEIAGRSRCWGCKKKKRHLVWLCNTQTQSWLQIGTREARGHTNWPTHLQWFPPGLLIGHSWTHVIGMLPLRHTDRTAFGNTRFLIPPLFCNSQTGVRACMHVQIQKPRWVHNNHRYNQHVNNPAIETIWFDLSSPVFYPIW